MLVSLAVDAMLSLPCMTRLLEFISNKDKIKDIDVTEQKGNAGVGCFDGKLRGWILVFRLMLTLKDRNR